MAYKILVSPRAQKEIEHAIDFYTIYSADAPAHFITELKDAYQALSANPFFAIKYKEIRSLKIRKFPYSLYYVVDETNDTLRILSCFHSSRNPNKRPRH
jgi:plasmid stabilization system protein ParE